MHCSPRCRSTRISESMRPQIVSANRFVVKIETRRGQGVHHGNPNPIATEYDVRNRCRTSSRSTRNSKLSSTEPRNVPVNRDRQSYHCRSSRSTRNSKLSSTEPRNAPFTVVVPGQHGIPTQRDLRCFSVVLVNQDPARQ